MKRADIRSVVLWAVVTTIAAISFIACRDSELEGVWPSGSGDGNAMACVAVEDFVCDDDSAATDMPTRVDVTVGAQGVTFRWAAGDRLGIISESDRQQMAFTIGEGVNSTYAIFKNGDFEMFDGQRYAAYYPYMPADVTIDKVPANYYGQHQTGNGSTAHLGKYDYLGSSPQPAKDGVAYYDFKHLGCLVRFVLHLPAEAIGDQLEDVTIASPQEDFFWQAQYDLAMENNISATKDVASRFFKVGLSDIRVERQDEQSRVPVVVYAMMPPKNNTGHWKVKVLGRDNVYMGSVSPKDEHRMGKAYSYDVYLEAGYEYVDLGLGSHILWATMNVGAAHETHAGWYFSWGGLNYYYEDSPGYPAYPQMFKNGQSDGYTGGATFPLERDAARVYWKDDWRVPTFAETQELIQCKKEWKDNYLGSGLNGYLITGVATGYTKRSIFIPAAGEYNFNNNASGLYHYNNLGDYWINGSSNGNAGGTFYFENKTFQSSTDATWAGQSIRAVKKADTYISLPDYTTWYGQTITITPTVVMKEGDRVAKIEWESSDVTSATISSASPTAETATVRVKDIEEDKTVIITATLTTRDGERSKTSGLVKISGKNTLFSFDDTEIALEVGNTYSFKAAFPEGYLGSIEQELGSVAWKSSNVKIASLTKQSSEDGAIKANAVGECVITATANGKTATCKVKVVRMTISETRKSMRVKENSRLTVGFDGFEKNPSTVFWSTSNSSVVSVSNGVVIAKSAGTATITASVTIAGMAFEKQCVINVEPRDFLDNLVIRFKNKVVPRNTNVKVKIWEKTGERFSVVLPAGYSVSWKLEDVKSCILYPDANYVDVYGTKEYSTHLIATIRSEYGIVGDILIPITIQW